MASADQHEGRNRRTGTDTLEEAAGVRRKISGKFYYMLMFGFLGVARDYRKATDWRTKEGVSDKLSESCRYWHRKWHRGWHNNFQFRVWSWE